MFRAVQSAALMLAVVGTGVGCSMTTVKKDPGSHDRGFRYYLPKPYLLVERSEKLGDAEGKTKEYSENVVRLSLEYLPDFSEEYSVHIRSGVGTNTTNLTITNGWRLDKVDVNVNSKATEFLEAVTKLIGTDPKLFEREAKPLSIRGGGGPALADNLPELMVEAYNVPLGYYESVIGLGVDGKKRLYGWRYVGFAPYANCPIEAQGAEQACCHEGDLYGLVSVGNKMYFRRLSELATHPTPVQVGEKVATAGRPPVPKGTKPTVPPPTPMGTQPPVPTPSQPSAGNETGYVVIPTPVKDLPVQPKK